MFLGLFGSGEDQPWSDQLVCGGGGDEVLVYKRPHSTVMREAPAASAVLSYQYLKQRRLYFSIQSDLPLQMLTELAKASET